MISEMDERRSVALKASGYVAAGLSRVKFKDGRLSLLSLGRGVREKGLGPRSIRARIVASV